MVLAKCDIINMEFNFSTHSIFFILLINVGKKTDEAIENRNYLASRMTDEINEIIRVLQLTTYDEDEWDADNLTCMKKAQARP